MRTVKNKAMKKYEMLEHTADIQIRSYGQDLPELFKNSALGMMDFIFGEGFERINIEETDVVKVKADDIEALLVEFLSELNFLINTNYRAYVDFEFGKFEDTHLKAKAWSCPALAKEYIKAVTYHELRIEKIDKGWQATIIYDI